MRDKYKSVRVLYRLMEVSDIELFLEAIEKSFEGMNQVTNWPMNGGQISSYFDVDEALDIYFRLKELKKDKSIKEISEMMPLVDIIRYFLANNAIIGLKVAKKLNIAGIKQKDILDFSEMLFEILKCKSITDPFCLDGRNFLLNNNEIEKIKQKEFNLPKNEEDKKKIAFLIVMANNYCYTLYYDIFQITGFIIHGPYDVSDKFGEGTIMLVRDYHNLKPTKLWPENKFPFNKLKVFGIYKNLSVGINFVNHLITKDSIGDKLIGYKIYLDDKEVEFTEVNKIIEALHTETVKQKKKIDSFSPLDKVRKGAEIAFYMFKDLREKMGEHWVPQNEIENTISKFDEKFIKDFNIKKHPPIEHWRKLFDPRNDHY